MTEILVHFDVTELVNALGNAARQLPGALRNVVNRSARTARRETIKVMVKDIGVPAKMFRSATPLVNAAKAGDLTARWFIGRKTVGLEKATKLTPMLSWNRGAAIGGTWNLEPGAGRVVKAFTTSKGKLFHRTGRGRYAFKALRTASPDILMRSEGAAPRVIWQQTAERELRNNLAIEVQKALEGKPAGIDATFEGA